MGLPSVNVIVQVAIVGLLTGGVYALMASGLTLVFGVMRVINIAHGAFLVLSAYFSYWLFTLFGIDPFLSIVLTVPALFLIGVGMQRLLLARVGNEPGLIVLVTFAIALSIEGLIGAMWKSTGRSVRTAYTGQVFILPVTEELTLRLPLVRLAGFGAAVVALGLLFVLLRYSKLGRAIRATIQNRDAAQLMGVNVARVQAFTFGIGLGTVAAGGAIFSLIWTFTGASHEEWISKMLSVIVFGGMGSLPGAFLAALIMGVVEAVSQVALTAYISPIVFYLILLMTLVIRPQGLLGTRIREG